MHTFFALVVCAAASPLPVSLLPLSAHASGTGVVQDKTTQVAASEAPAALSSAVDQAAIAAQVDASGFSQSANQLELWNSPAFQREFVQSYMAVTEVEPRVTEEERERIQEILNLMASNKTDKAIQLVQKNLDEASSATFDFLLANFEYQREDYVKAAAAYQTAVEKYPKFRRAWKNLAMIHVQNGEFEKAAGDLTRVIELGGSDASTFGLLGHSYSNLEDHVSAESAYRMASLIDPKSIDWKMGLALCFFKQESYGAASVLFGSLIAQNPERTDLWLFQANAYLGLNQPLKAAENFEIVERLGQSTAESMNTLGDIYTNEGLFQMAVEAYSKALDKSPRSAPDRALLAAKVLIARGAHAETKILIDRLKALEADSLQPEARKDLLKLEARLAMAAGAGEEEARVLEEIVSLDPLDGEALILLGKHSRRAGDDQKAIFYFERAASIEGSEAQAKVEHGQLLVAQGKYQDALPLLRRAQVLVPRENVSDFIAQIERAAQTR